MAGSTLRFCGFAMFVVFGWAFSLYMASTEGWCTTLGFAVFFGSYQLMKLYALHRMILKNRGQDLDEVDTRWHFIFGVAIFIALIVGGALLLRLVPRV